MYSKAAVWSSRFSNWAINSHHFLFSWNHPHARAPSITTRRRFLHPRHPFVSRKNLEEERGGKSCGTRKRNGEKNSRLLPRLGKKLWKRSLAAVETKNILKYVRSIPRVSSRQLLPPNFPSFEPVFVKTRVIQLSRSNFYITFSTIASFSSSLATFWL